MKKTRVDCSLGLIGLQSCNFSFAVIARCDYVMLDVCLFDLILIL